MMGTYEEEGRRKEKRERREKTSEAAGLVHVANLVELFHQHLPLLVDVVEVGCLPGHLLANVFAQEDVLERS